MKRSLMTFVLAAALVAAPSARASSELDNARHQIRSGQQEPLIELLHAADGKRQAIEESIARIQNKINDIQTQLNQLQPELEVAKRQRDMAEQATKAAADAYEGAKKNLTINAVTLYASGGWESTLSLFTSADVASYASAKVYLDTVIDSGARIVDGLRDSRDRLHLQQALVEKQTKAILDKTRTLQAQQQRLIDLAHSKEQVSSDLTAALIARTQALTAITNDPTGFDVILKSYGAGTSNIRLLLAAAQAGQPVEKPQAGTLWWPVIGRISSPFGYRIHPILKVRSFHTGVDIAADYGAPIRAAQPGTVVDVVYLGAYGMVTIVDHGFSLATMYAHQSRSLVHPGQRVQAGQVIGAVGCTGWCTGPHIHFEVWSRSEPQNPIRWL